MKRRRLKAEVIAIIGAVTITLFVGTRLIPHVEKQRGYVAIGGEWILLVMVFIGALYITLGWVAIAREHKELKRYGD